MVVFKKANLLYRLGRFDESLPLFYSALAIAERLEGHAKLARVIYPGLTSHPDHAVAARQLEKGGTVVSLDLKGGQEAAFSFLNALKIIIISNNLGDAKSLITHPATTTHKNLAEEDRAELRISEGLLRLSVGLEDVDDLIEDLDQAFTATK